MHPVRFAVVGARGYSRDYLAILGTLEQEGLAQLSASMMIDAEDHPDLVKAFENRGVPVFDEYQGMLDACRDTVDVVGLPVPIHLHAPPLSSSTPSSRWIRRHCSSVHSPWRTCSSLTSIAW